VTPVSRAVIARVDAGLGLADRVSETPTDEADLEAPSQG
jgi:hypothetical protein